MVSVSHQCEQCGKVEGDIHETGKIVRFRLNTSGVPRPKCLPCENVYTANWKNWRTALTPVQQYDAVPVHTGTARGALVLAGDEHWHMVALADICDVFGIASNSQIVRLKNDPNYAPYLRKGYDIISQGDSRELWLLRYDKVPGWLSLINPNKVRADRYAGLVAYRDVAIKVLSDYFLGTKSAPPSPVVTPHSETTAIDQLTTGFVALFGPAIERLVIEAIRREKGTTPDEDREVLENTRVVREGIGGVLIKEVPVKEVVTDEWMSTGTIYLAVERRKGLMSVGLVMGGRTPEQRMNDGDYNGGKSNDNHWEVVYSFQTDKPNGVKKNPGAELVLIGYVARMGIEQLSDGGRFRYDPRVEDHFKRLPRKMKFVNLHRFIDQAGLFPEVLFAGVCNQ